jgi:hypothetical protein
MWKGCNRGAERPSGERSSGGDAQLRVLAARFGSATSEYGQRVEVAGVAREQ